MVWCEKFMENVEQVYSYNRDRTPPEKPQISTETNFPAENQNKPEFSGVSRRETRVEKSIVEKTREDETNARAREENSGKLILPVRDDDYENPEWLNFCQAYGCENRRCHKTTFTAWRHAVRKFPPDEIAAGAMAYRLHNAKSGNTKFKPHNWLDGEEWTVDWANEPIPNRAGSYPGKSPPKYTSEQMAYANEMVEAVKAGALDEEARKWRESLKKQQNDGNNQE
jgi:hypothetical protein